MNVPIYKCGLIKFSLLVGLLFCTYSNMVIAEEPYTISCKVEDSSGLYRDFDFTWTINSDKKEYFRWASKKLGYFEKFTDAEMCFRHKDHGSEGLSYECINRFSGRFIIVSVGIPIAGGDCNKISYKPIPERLF